MSEVKISVKRVKLHRRKPNMTCPVQFKNR